MLSTKDRYFEFYRSKKQSITTRNWSSYHFCLIDLTVIILTYPTNSTVRSPENQQKNKRTINIHNSQATPTQKSFKKTHKHTKNKTPTYSHYSTCTNLQPLQSLDSYKPISTSKKKP